MTIRKNTEDVKDKTLQRDQFINFCKGSLTEDDLKVFNNFSNNERDNLASPDKNTIYIRSRVPAANCLCNNIFANENIINLVRRLSSQSKTLLPVVLDKVTIIFFIKISIKFYINYKEILWNGSRIY